MTNITRAAEIGDTVEILPGYSMDTSSRSRWDDIAGRACTVLRFSRDGKDAIAMIKGYQYEEFVPRSRLKPVPVY